MVFIVTSFGPQLVVSSSSRRLENAATAKTAICSVGFYGCSITRDGSHVALRFRPQGASAIFRNAIQRYR
jgi:hypothetical protein